MTKARTLLLLASLILPPSVHCVNAGELGGGTLTALSGAGYSVGDHRTSVLINPAAAGVHRPGSHFTAGLNGSGSLAERDDFLDRIDDLIDYLEYLQTLTLQDLEPGMADEAISYLRSVEDKSARLRGDASLVLSFPNPMLSAAPYYRIRGDLGIIALVEASDYDLIENAIHSPFYPDDMDSSILVQGHITQEFGVALARSLPLGPNGRVTAGLTPRYVHVENFAYSATVANYVEDEFEQTEYTRSSSHLNLDVGFTHRHGGLRTSLTLTNLLRQNLTTADHQHLAIRTQATTAVGYVAPLFSLEAALDLNAVPDFASGEDSQLLRLGAELTPLPWLHLRAGVLRELRDSRDDSFSLGFGVSPGDRFFLDMALLSGDRSSAGVALGLGVSF